LEDYIKRLGLLTVILLTLLMAACNPFESESTNEGGQFTNVEYSEDGKSVTIYIDGCAPVPASRSLSKSQAILGHDFFEVTFIYCPSVNNYIIARGRWELGQPAGVNGIYRTQGGVNYDAAITRTPDATHGTAILFAGKKTDKTLLAVGALSAVDGNPASRSISNATKSVSFELNALKAGAVNEQNNPNDPPETSSFYTNAASPGNTPTQSRTWVADLNISFRKYPVFGVPDNSSTLRAIYNIRTHSASHPFSEYNPGIILATSSSASPDYYYTYGGATNNKKVEKVQPHFTLPDETTWNTAGSTNPYSTGTTVGLANNNSAIGDLFVNPIQFTLDTTDVSVADGQILSITFQIPVYAISASNDPVMWFIRPGYDKYREELDDGRFGNGGAVLISIGQMQSTPLYSLKVTDVPFKYNYNAVVSGAYTFDLTGSKIQFFMGGNALYTSTDGANPADAANPAGRLKYYIDWNNNYNSIGRPDTGSGPWPPYTTDQQIFYSPAHVFPNNINRVLTIIVEYHDTDFNSHDNTTEYYYDTFQINVNTLNVDISNIPLENRFLVGRENDLGVANGLYAAVNARSGVFMVVLTQSFDFATHTFPLNGGDVTIIVTATKPNLIVGRAGTGGTGATWTFSPGVYNATVFFGTWPFNEPIMVGGQVLEDHSFRFNTTGSYADYTAPTNNITNVFVNQGTAASLSVFRGSEVTQKGLLFSSSLP